MGSLDHIVFHITIEDFLCISQIHSLNLGKRQVSLAMHPHPSDIQQRDTARSKFLFTTSNVGFICFRYLKSIGSPQQASKLSCFGGCACRFGVSKDLLSEKMKQKSVESERDRVR